MRKKKYSQFNWVKIKCIRLGIRVKDVYELTDYKSYNYFVQIINGYCSTPKKFEDKIKQVFKYIEEKNKRKN